MDQTVDTSRFAIAVRTRKPARVDDRRTGAPGPYNASDGAVRLATAALSSVGTSLTIAAKGDVPYVSLRDAPSSDTRLAACQGMSGRSSATRAASSFSRMLHRGPRYPPLQHRPQLRTGAGVIRAFPKRP